LGLLRNWTSLTGLVIISGSLFSFLLLFTLDTLAHFSNPYIGVLTYLVAPVFLLLGTVLLVLGMLLERRQIIKAAGAAPPVVINLSRPRDRKLMVLFLTGAVCFLLVSALGSYHTYHYTESVRFCGQTCHTVMQPELTTYQHGPHARVSCAQCHIGTGATWYVRSKLSGAYQVYATLANKFPRPIPTPVKNLRPAQETCEQCHWPKKFVGNLDRTFTYFLGEQTNPVHSVRMLLKVGGADPAHGPVGGIHWHMNVGNKVEYLAADEARQNISWVRLTSPQGVVTEFRSAGFTNEVRQANVRTMDCMDCHNRPAHVLESPNNAVNLALALGQIDPTLDYIKTNAVFVLTRPYRTETEALQSIATTLASKYPRGAGDLRVAKAIDTVQRLYRDNFFPQMKADWRVYPNNIGHKDWPGCFRCHDGKHQAPDGKHVIKASDCNACHIILAQGRGEEFEQLNARGQEFKHPGGPLDAGFLCNDCHSGGP
jgi:nitrate/TMAO reductase-like tetraheme cytochrome c subunit